MRRIILLLLSILATASNNWAQAPANPKKDNTGVKPYVVASYLLQNFSDFSSYKNYYDFKASSGYNVGFGIKLYNKNNPVLSFPIEITYAGIHVKEKFQSFNLKYLRISPSFLLNYKLHRKADLQFGIVGSIWIPVRNQQLGDIYNSNFVPYSISMNTYSSIGPVISFGVHNVLVRIGYDIALTSTIQSDGEYNSYQKKTRDVLIKANTLNIGLTFYPLGL